MTQAARPALAPESAAQRQARLRLRSARQREALEADWQRIAPTLSAVDAAMARLRRLRNHPVALGLATLSATGLLAGGRGRRLLGRMRTGWRLATGASVLLTLWRALRAARGGRS